MASNKAPAPLLYNTTVRLIDGMRRHSFRKWYERELMQSHAHLALTFLCAVGLLAAFDAATQFTSWSDRVVDTVAIVVCGSVGYWALRRYLVQLMHAENVANQANCPQCGVYARFKLVDGAARAHGVAVRCRDCAHQWSIDD